VKERKRSAFRGKIKIWTIDRTLDTGGGEGKKEGTGYGTKMKVRSQKGAPSTLLIVQVEIPKDRENAKPLQPCYSDKSKKNRAEKGSLY